MIIKFIVKIWYGKLTNYFCFCLNCFPLWIFILIVLLRKKLAIHYKSSFSKKTPISLTLIHTKTITFLLWPCMPQRKQGCHFEKDGSVQSLVMWPGQPHLKHPRWWQFQWRCPMKPHKIHIFSCHWNRKMVSDKQMNKIHEHIVIWTNIVHVSKHYDFFNLYR